MSGLALIRAIVPPRQYSLRYKDRQDRPALIMARVMALATLATAVAHLVWLYFQSHAVDRLTSDGDYDEIGPEWSPDGSRIAFSSNHDENRERTRNTDVFVVDAKLGSCERE